MYTRKLEFPTFFSCLRNYSLVNLQQDFLAGTTVAIVAFPLAMALAIACGVSPEKGLITAIIGGFLISIFSGSRHQIGGPTAAFIVVIVNVIQNHGYDGLVIASFMSGFLLIIGGLCRIGSFIKYIPYSVVTGFTVGLAFVIFTAQLKDFLGFTSTEMSASYLGQWYFYAHHLRDIDYATLIVGLFSLIAIAGIRRICPKFPALLLVVIIASVIVWFFNLNVATISSKFGELSAQFPFPTLPEITLERVIDLFPSAFTITLLAGIESLLCATISDEMTGENHAPNTELIGQGIANVFCSLFGALPATAAIARTAANIRAGAYSPISGIVHAFMIFIFMGVLSPFIGHIPLCSLAAVLIIIAYDMSELEKFIYLLKAPYGDRFILVTTCLLTIVFDMIVAIQVGIILAALVFMRRMSLITNITPEKNFTANEINEGIEGVQIFNIQGPFFFGAASRLRMALDRFHSQKIIIFNLTNMSMIDTTGTQILKQFIKKCIRQDSIVICVGLNSKAEKILIKLGLYKLLPQENLTASLEEALTLSRNLIKLKSTVKI